VRVAVGRFHFHHAFAHFEDRNVERAAAEIVNRDGFVLLLVQPVSQRRRRRLIDDTHHFQTGNLAGVLGGLPLRVVEVRRHRDHRLRDLLPQVRFGRFLSLVRIIAEISGGEYFLPLISTRASPLSPRTTL